MLRVAVGTPAPEPHSLKRDYVEHSPHDTVTLECLALWQVLTTFSVAGMTSRFVMLMMC